MKKILKSFITLVIVLGTISINLCSIKAANVTFRTTASTSKVVVGNTFTVTVKVSSTEILGSWEYTISYDSSVLSLVSGKKSVADPGNGSQKSQSYTYKFKAIKSGSSNISVKSYGAFSWDESKLTPTASGTTVKVITKADLQASYSKDNNLKSLSVEGATLSPEFDQNVTDYKVDLDSNTTSILLNASTNDSKASVVGIGTFEVVEGENKFQITVTAENGATKVYNLVANVVDPYPITVKTVENEELTVVKRSVVLTLPTSYVLTTTTINGQEVPALKSEITKFTLVGLKNSKGEIGLYIQDNNKYTKYTEVKLNELILFPIDIEENELFGYEKTKITINGEEIEAYKYTNKSNFAIISAIDTETGKKNYYMYDIKNNTVTFYNEEEIDDLNTKVKTYTYIIIGLLAETLILFIIIVLLLKKKSNQNKKRKEKIEKAKEKLETKKKKETKEDKKENKEK